MNNDFKYWVALSKTGVIGAVRFKKLYTYFPDMEKAYRASFNELMQAGVEKNIVDDLMAKRKNINPEEEYEKLIKENVKVITIKDKSYPKLLRELYDAPALLYYRGILDSINDFSIAVVGARKVSSYGKQITPFICRELARQGAVIVSGLALGIDTLAHNSALEEKKKTFAVLGSGIDEKSIYPSINRDLAKQIIENGGAIISELPIGSPPFKHHFPQRNRIISGLSVGTLVIEAGEISGALITAKTALDQNREVFAVPGNILSLQSRGANDLIKKGAHPVCSAADILEILDFKRVMQANDNKKIIPDSKEEDSILNILSNEPMHIDFIVKNTKLDISVINSNLLLMEMKGKVKNLGGNMYVIG